MPQALDGEKKMDISTFLHTGRPLDYYLVSWAAFGIGTGIYELVFNLHLIRLGRAVAGPRTADRA